MAPNFKGYIVQLQDGKDINLETEIKKNSWHFAYTPEITPETMVQPGEGKLRQNLRQAPLYLHFDSLYDNEPADWVLKIDSPEGERYWQWRADYRKLVPKPPWENSRLKWCFAASSILLQPSKSRNLSWF